MSSYLKIGSHNIIGNIRLPYLHSTKLRVGFSLKFFIGRIVDTTGIVSNCKASSCTDKTALFIDFDTYKIEDFPHYIPHTQLGRIIDRTKDFTIIERDITELDIYSELDKLIRHYGHIVGNIYVFQSIVDNKLTNSYRAISPVMINKDMVKEIIRTIKYVDLEFYRNLIRFSSQTIRIDSKYSNRTILNGIIYNPLLYH